MKKLDAFLPGQGGSSCDRCRAPDILQGGFFYACSECKFNLCANCARKDEGIWKAKQYVSRFEEEKEGEKEKLAKEQLENIELDQADLTENIQVTVSILDSDGYTEKPREGSDTAVLRVNIDDKLDKINTYLKLGGKGGGDLTSYGKVIKKVED